MDSTVQDHKSLIFLHLLGALYPFLCLMVKKAGNIFFSSVVRPTKHIKLQF
jgi:hypothetical protein